MLPFSSPGTHPLSASCPLLCIIASFALADLTFDDTAAQPAAADIQHQRVGVFHSIPGLTQLQRWLDCLQLACQFQTCKRCAHVLGEYCLRASTCLHCERGLPDYQNSVHDGQPCPASSKSGVQRGWQSGSTREPGKKWPRQHADGDKVHVGRAGRGYIAIASGQTMGITERQAVASDLNPESG